MLIKKVRSFEINLQPMQQIAHAQCVYVRKMRDLCENHTNSHSPIAHSSHIAHSIAYPTSHMVHLLYFIGKIKSNT